MSNVDTKTFLLAAGSAVVKESRCVWRQQMLAAGSYFHLNVPFVTSCGFSDRNQEIKLGKKKKKRPNMQEGCDTEHLSEIMCFMFYVDCVLFCLC